jgi:hypothetical protein
MISGLQRKPLGQWLVDERVVDELSLQRALAEQRRHGGRLGDRLVRQGSLSARDLGRCLALQHDLLWVSLGLSPPAADALRRVSGATARQLGAVPVTVLSGTLSNMLLVAFAEPPPESTLAWLRSETGMQVEPALADPEEVQHALRFYEALHLPMMRAEHDGGSGADGVPQPLPGEEGVDASIAALVDRDLLLESLPEADAAEVEPEPVTAGALPAVALDRVEAAAGELPELPVLRTDSTPAAESANAVRLRVTGSPTPAGRSVPGSWVRPAVDVLGDGHDDHQRTDPDRPVATLESVAALRARVESLEATVARLVPLAEEAQGLRARLVWLESMVAGLQAQQSDVPGPASLPPPLPTRALEDAPHAPPVTDDEDPDGLFVGLRTAAVPPVAPPSSVRVSAPEDPFEDSVPLTPSTERPTPFAFLLDEARRKAQR